MKTAIWLANILKKAGGACLVAMMLLSSADVVTSVFGHPILGCEELVGLMAALVLAFALPATQLDKGHIGVDLLRLRLPQRVNRFLDLFNSLAGGALFLIVAWQCFRYASKLRAVGQVSTTLQLPTYFLVYCVALACLVLAYVMFMEVVAARKGVNRE